MKYLPVVQTAFSAKSLAAARVLLPLFYVLLSLPLCVHAAGSLTLDSTSLAYQVTIPVDYTCDGKDISPELEWKNPPANTQSYVLMLADPDAPGELFIIGFYITCRPL